MLGSLFLIASRRDARKQGALEREIELKQQDLKNAQEIKKRVNESRTTNRNADNINDNAHSVRTKKTDDEYWFRD